MSKAIVNMTPNPSDIQTIHCSQGDTEAREWEFELHNNGEVIDAVEITDQIVFKAYEGGTEELLPSSLMNGSVDLGSLAWTYMPNNYFRSTSVISDAKIPSNENTVANIFCSILKSNTANNVYANNEGIAIDGTGRIRIYYDDMPTDAVSFAQAMQGVLLWYEKNDSTPTTTPFLGDIKYPQGLLTNQQFTYRESPTEEDGLANIVDIKGQTLKWNQQSQSSRTTGTAYGLTFSCTDGLWSFQGTYTGGNGSAFRCGNSYVPIPAGHKVLLLNTSPWKVRLQGNEPSTNENTPQNRILQTENGALADIVVHAYGLASGDTVNVQYRFGIIDLTVMFGETKANEIYAMEMAQSGSGVAYFKSFFPLDYYPYNSGSLIPFMGNGLKTTGKNLFQNNAVNKTQLGITFTINDDKSITVNGTATGIAYLTHQTGLSAPNIKKGESLILSGSLNLPQSKAYFQLVYKGVSTGTTYSFVSTNASSVSINATEDMTLSGIYFNIASGATVNNMTAYPMLRYADTDSTYEPYTESVINLPISTYFPNGMKQAGTVYDELTPSKASTRVGSCSISDFGSTSSGTSYGGLHYADFTPSLAPKLNSINIVTNKDIAIKGVEAGWASTTPCIIANSSFIRIYGTTTDIKTEFSGMEIYFELATPIETSFTTASLVTENAEIPLSNEDGVLVGKCTEELSADAGFIEGKIKLSDSDGDVYSNKIQIHVERMPE